MTCDTPLVSVLMTAYNREMYITEAIESVLNSTYQNFELIIVDDGSSDNTVSIAQSFEKKDNRVSLYINEKNLGDYPNRNRAAGLARGEFLMYVDSDDSILPDGIEYFVNQFSKHPHAQFSLLYYKKEFTIPTVLKPEESVRYHFFKDSILNIGPGGTIIKKELFNRLGKFPELYGPANDMYYNLKVASNADILLLPYIYLNYRIHDAQEKKNIFGYLKSNFAYICDIMKLPEMPLTNDEKKFIRKKIAKLSLQGFAKYAIKTLKFQGTYRAYKSSGLKLKDIL